MSKNFKFGPGFRSKLLQPKNNLVIETKNVSIQYRNKSKTGYRKLQVSRDPSQILQSKCFRGQKSLFVKTLLQMTFKRSNCSAQFCDKNVNKKLEKKYRAIRFLLKIICTIRNLISHFSDHTPVHKFQ